MLWFALAHDGFDSTVSWSKTPSQVRNLVGTAVKDNTAILPIRVALNVGYTHIAKVATRNHYSV